MSILHMYPRTVCISGAHRDEKRPLVPCWSYRWLWAAVWMVGTEAGDLTMEESLQAPDKVLFTSFLHTWIHDASWDPLKVLG